MPTDRNASTLLAANQNIPRQHQVTDIFETDGSNVERQTILRCNLGNHLGGRHRFDHFPFQSALRNQMPEQNGKYLMRIDGASLGVNSPNAIGVAVRSETGV